MGQDKGSKAGLAGHFLKLAGKVVYSVGIASDRREDGKCWKCGERPPAKGVTGSAGTCKSCARELLGKALEVADALEDDDDG